MSAERVELLHRWHEQASADLHRRSDNEVEYLDMRLHVPPMVFPPAPMSKLLGRAVLAETSVDDRVLDMGTGCGVNAILAARVATDVTAVDINPDAVAAARLNCGRMAACCSSSAPRVTSATSRNSSPAQGFGAKCNRVRRCTTAGRTRSTSCSYSLPDPGSEAPAPSTLPPIRHPR